MLLFYRKYLYTCKLNLKNTLDVGNTDLNFFNLFPVLPPYRLSSYTKNICKKLNIEEKELADLVVYTSAGEDVREQYKMDIHTITRLPQFKELCVKAGFDSIKATEGGNITYGVFDSNLIEILDIKDLKK